MAQAKITDETSYSVDEAVDRLTSQLKGRGITVFARIDHAAGARAIGLELADEQLLIFGDPRVGTALMQADARVGLDLPLRILVWDDNGTTRVAAHDPTDLAQGYALGDSCEIASKLEALIKGLVGDLSRFR
jgi:uncharacterized protein (DUF302 family)